MVCCRPTTRSPQQAEVQPEDLREEPFVAMRSGYLMHRFAHRLFGGRLPATSFSTDGAEMGKLMVADGLGVTVLPDYSVDGDPMVRAGLITHRPLAGDTTTVTLLMLHRRVDQVPPTLRGLKEALLDRAQGARPERRSRRSAMMRAPSPNGALVPEPRDARLAVLIDADNTSPTHADNLLGEVAKYGTPTVKRAYGDWTTPSLKGWKDVLPRQRSSPMQQFANTAGKNATDSALIIDAMDLLYTGNLDAFALVSSDSDFTRLATRLRESGATVYGLGMRKTPEPFRAACDRFIFLEVLRSGDTPASQRRAGPRPARPAPADGQGGRQHLPGRRLGQPRRRSAATSAPPMPRSTRATTTSRSSSSLARAQDYLEVKQSGSGSNATRVRLKPVTATKTTTRKRAPAKKAASKQ